MKPEQLAKWKENRKKGMLRFVLVHGVLSFGLPMFVAMTLFRKWGNLNPQLLAISVVGWTLGGATFGAAMWFIQERQLRKAEQAEAECVRWQNNMLTQHQKSAAIAGPCFALRFLVDSENRHHARAQMAGFSDAAIFHRWMNLTWTLREPDAIALLTSYELRLLAQFNLIYESLPWVPMETHPFISDTSQHELNKLTPIATELLRSLENRTRRTGMLPTLSSWWRGLRSIATRTIPTNNPMDRSGGSAAY